MSTQWEYKDFVWTSTTQRWVILGSNYNEVTASQMWWQEDRNAILSELHSWTDQGWEPVGNIGPECYQLRKYTRSRLANQTGAQWVFDIVMLFITLGLWLIMMLLYALAQDSYVEPVSFRLPMRRRRGS